MIKQSKNFTLAAVALAVICALPQIASASQFWSREIETALAARTEFLEQIGLTDKDFLSAGALDGSQKQLFEERLSTQRRSQSPWYYYLNGLIDEENSGAFYGQALIRADSDPGALWLLSLEFIRHNKLPWAANSMLQLEKIMLSLGGTSAPLISRQLLLAGRGFETQGTEQAEFCCVWAKRFDSGQFWSAYMKGKLRFPASALSSVSAFVADAGSTLSASWRTQLTFAAQAHRFLRAAFFIFICAVFLVFSLKYLPSGVHFLGDRLFGSAPPVCRTISGIIIVLSLFSLGIFTEFWVIAFMIRRFLSGGEKRLLTFVCALLALAPIDGWVTNMFLRNAAANSTAAVFERVNSEGYSEELHRTVLNNAQTNGGNYLNQLSLAVSAVKGGEYNLGAEALNNALRLAPQEPMTLLCAGNISFLLGDFDAMERYYGELLKKQPKNTEAIFNLSQIMLRKDGFAAAALMDKAASLEPAKVNSFVKLNELYFSGDTPPLRGLMQPHISPKFFWGKLFLAEGGALARSQAVWNRAFWGINPALSFGIFLFLLIAMFTADKVFWSGEKLKLRKYFTCKICGQLICRRCRKGMMCASCYKESAKLHNSAAMINNLQRERRDVSAAYRRVLKLVLGSLVPGAEKLYEEEAAFKPAFIMFFSSVVLGACYWAFTFYSSYPKLTVLNPIYLVAILLIYNILAFIRHLKSLAGFLIALAKAKNKSAV